MYYTLKMNTVHQPIGDVTVDSCGQSQSILGLQFGGIGLPLDMDKIPYGGKVEVPLSFTNDGYCNSFTGVSVKVIATCEQPSSNSQVVQYSVVPGSFPVQIDYNISHGLFANNFTLAIPDFSWSSSRRLSGEVSVDVSGLHTIIKDETAKLKDEINSNVAGLMEENAKLRGETTQMKDEINNNVADLKEEILQQMMSENQKLEARISALLLQALAASQTQPQANDQPSVSGARDNAVN